MLCVCVCVGYPRRRNKHDVGKKALTLVGSYYASVTNMIEN